MPIVLLFSFILSSFACDGGMFQKFVSIPVGSLKSNDMTEEVFKASVKKFEKFWYSIIEQEHDGDLILYASWKSNTVNAFAEREDRKMRITVYGGLARHQAITEDGLVTVLCHELGHHLGGYPKKSGNKWSSAEGQADYYATMKCLRRYWQSENNIAAMANVEINPKLKEECAATYKTEAEQALCHRMGLGGRSVALMIQDLDHDSLVPKFETPETFVARAMVYTHPYSQCRLDTYFMGAVCPVNEMTEFDDDNEQKGACHAKNGDTRGLRPKCWFKARE